MAATRDVDGAVALPVGGMDERAIPEAIQPDDFPYLRGWVQDQIGNLRRTPGKRFLSIAMANLRGQPILSITPFGDFVLIQTETQLFRFSNPEIFGGTEFTNILTPDIYPITAAEEEAMSQILLKYHVPTGTNGAAIPANLWTKVPLSGEMRDTGGNCVLNAGGSFSLSAAAYPKNVRLKATVNVSSPNNDNTNANAVTNAQTKLRTTAGVDIESGMNTKIITTNVAASKRQTVALLLQCAFVLAAPTEYQIDIFASKATIFGEAGNIGTEEKYALVELLIE